MGGGGGGVQMPILIAGRRSGQAQPDGAGQGVRGIPEQYRKGEEGAAACWSELDGGAPSGDWRWRESEANDGTSLGFVF